MEVKYKKRTFLQFLTGQKPQTEVTFYNPLSITPGAMVNINAPDCEGKDYRLVRIVEYTRRIDGRTYVTTYYDLECKGSGTGQWETVRLAANKINNAKKDDPYSFAMLLLRKDDEMQWNEDIQGVIDDALDNKKWIIDDDGKDEQGNQMYPAFHHEYDRCHGMNSMYEAKVAIIEDENDDGVYQEDEVRESEVSYLDFWRTIEIEGGDEVTEFFFVERDEDSGYVTMWIGTEFDPSHVKVL